jgi:hypothetical protein
MAAVRWWAISDSEAGNTRRPMDDFEITIDLKGTTVTVRRWRR